MTRRQIAESYMVFGGVPYYLRLLSPRYSIHQDIERFVFAPGGQLQDEHHYLFASLFKNSDSYISVIKALASGTNGLDREELVSRTGLKSGGQLTKILTELEACDFIRKYRDFTKTSSGYIYQLMDAFTLFYFRFVENGKLQSWLDHLHSPGYYAWSGIAFERVCLLHSAQIKDSLRISGISSSEFAWRSKAAKQGAQIDLLIDRKDGIIDLCEMKYTEDPLTVSSDLRQELERKRTVFRNETKTDKAIHILLISAGGFTERQPDETIQYKFSLDNLF